MSDGQKFTGMVLSYGDVQVSPQEVATLNQQAMEPIPGGRYGNDVLLTGYARHVYKSEQNKNTFLSLQVSLESLRSNPRSPKARRLKGSITTFSTEFDPYRLDYQIYSGQVTVFNIQLVDRQQKMRDSLEQPALYKVKKNNGVWSIAGKTDKVTTSYAAVNGQSNNLAKAHWLMGAHLDFEFGDAVTEYTLFHNPSVGGGGDTWESMQDKMGFTTPVTKKFAKALSDAQKSGNETTWLGHSQGGVIIAEGVRYLLNHESSWSFKKLSFNGANNDQKGELLDKQRVVLHGNANNNWRSSRLFERAGVKVVSIKAHDYDFVTNLIGANTVNPRKLVGSMVYANHVTGGSISQSPHTTAQSMESWEANMQNGPGKGRNSIQKVHHAAGNKISSAVRHIKNAFR